jgi:hypothetical protein
MFEGCVTVLYLAQIFGLSLLGLSGFYQFKSLWSLMLCICVCSYICTLIVITTPNACNNTFWRFHTRQ